MKTTIRRKAIRRATKPRRKVARAATEIGGKWAWHYRTLIELREQLLQQKLLRASEVTTPIEPHGAHEADSGTDEFDHNIALTLLAHEEDALREVQEAIHRILSGRYGLCEASGRPIAAARLRALPWCRYARDPQSESELAAGVGEVRVVPLLSLRGKRADIPYTGEVWREGHEPDPWAREEPKAGKSAQANSTDDAEAK